MPVYSKINEIGLGKLTKEQEDIFAGLTQKLIKTIESGEDIPWRNPVRSGAQELPPTNFVSKEPYTGINLLILTAARRVNPYWLTFQQVKKLNGKIRKGTHGERIIYYAPAFHDKKTNKRIPEPEAKKSPKENFYVKNIVKYYTVHNLEDVTGIDHKIPDIGPRKKAEAIEAAEKLISSMPNPPRINIIENSFTPHFNAAEDTVNMPSRAYIESDQAYYSVFFHELIHSTMIPSRTDRARYYKNKNQETYAFEELIAELGAVFLCAETGILFHTYNNSVSYLKNWRKVLVQLMKKDIQFVAKAAVAAQHAVDYMLTGDVPDYDESDDQPEPDPEPASKWALVKDTNWKGRYVEILQRNERGLEVIWADEKGWVMPFEAVHIQEKDLPEPWFPLNAVVFRTDKEDFKQHIITGFAYHEDPHEFLYLCMRDADGGYWLSRSQIQSEEDIKTMLLLRKRKREREI